MKEWTIMVYMAGDNNLSEDMVTGLKGMVKYAGKKNINLLAAYDSCAPPVPVKIYDFSTHKPNATLRDYAVSQRIVAAIPYTSKEFLGVKHFAKWVLRNGSYKAKRYGLVLSGHSDGILGRSLLRDDAPQMVLDLKKLRGILNKARSYLPRTRKKFDLLGFDGCLMSMLEVCYELRDICDILLGSEGNIPSAGWSYEQIIAAIPNAGNIGAADLALNTVDAYVDYSRDYEVGGRALDISACDLTKIDQVVRDVRRLGGIFGDILDLPTGSPLPATDEETANYLVKQFFIDSFLLAHYESQLYLHDQASDILDLARNLMVYTFKKYIENFIVSPPSTPVGRLAMKIFGRLIQRTYTIYQRLEADIRDYANPDRFVLRSRDIGPEYQYSTGVSIFFPWTEIAYDLAYKRYEELDFNRRSRKWMEFIDKFTNYTLREGAPPNFLAAMGVAGAPNAAAKLNINLQMYGAIGHREHAGREHAGREHAGRGELESFYRYFEEFQNYSTEIRHS